MCSSSDFCKLANSPRSVKMRAAVFSALWALTCARRAEIPQASTAFPDIDDTMLAAGDKGGALLPGLVVPVGYTYSFGILGDDQKYHFKQNRANNYNFTLREVCEETICTKFDKARFMYTTGTLWSEIVGSRRVNVLDSNGRLIFRVMNEAQGPFSGIFGRRLFRVLPPHTKNDSDVLFTMSKEVLRLVSSVLFRMSRF
eukprot:TRINITY_DN55426_c0_g1_i2.p1 TRINITY_DN55426_c0_g1~~TRINITY_DN55426_c0_g1_i2.p1  ORF type:complete len:199 (-),score=12.67 TRINITY_DN55426_c0_g1_i2:38-634(-)